MTDTKAKVSYAYFRKLGRKLHTNNSTSLVSDYENDQLEKASVSYAHFRKLERRLLILKCAYYRHSTSLVSDYEYDQLEKEWHKVGVALGKLAEDETSPCVDFDERHPEANYAIHFCNRTKQFWR